MKDLWLDTGTPPRRHENAPRYERVPAKRTVTMNARFFVAGRGKPKSYQLDEEFTRPDLPSGPAYRAARRRIQAWMSGERGCV